MPCKRPIKGKDTLKKRYEALNWGRLQNHCFLAPKGKTTKKQRKALKQRQEAFKRACKTGKQEEKQPIDKTPKVFPPISLTGK